MDVKHVWNSQPADIAAAIIERSPLFAEMLGSWQSDTTAVFQDDKPNITREYFSLMSEFADRLTTIQRATYLAEDHCPLVAEFVSLMSERNVSFDFMLHQLERAPFEKLCSISRFNEAVGLIQQRVSLDQKLQPATEPDRREQVMREIIKANPGQTSNSYLATFKETAEKNGLPGIGREAGQEMVRCITGRPKKPHRKD